MFELTQSHIDGVLNVLPPRKRKPVDVVAVGTCRAQDVARDLATAIEGAGYRVRLSTLDSVSPPPAGPLTHRDCGASYEITVALTAG